MINLVQFISISMITLGFSSGNVYESETLKIEQVSDNIFKHISYFESDDYGKVPCNGMIYFNGNEAIIFDTPTDDSVSAELITWIQNERKHKIKAVVVTHFHLDCLGGLSAFHSNQIPSYANKLTVKLAQTAGHVLPINSFEDELTLQIGNEPVILKFFGEGHTADNVVGYVPSEKAIFGGCLVKSAGAGKGNLADANVTAWPNTIKKIKSELPDLKTVIPGHGQHGGEALLDYTIELFEN